MPENSNLTRRTVVKGAAWTAPVVVAAVAVPAVAASDATILPTVTGCHTVSGKVWSFRFQVSLAANATQKTVNLGTVTVLKSNGTSDGTTDMYSLTAAGTKSQNLSVTLNPGTSQFLFATVTAGSSSGTHATVSLPTGKFSTPSPYTVTPTCPAGTF